MKGRYIIILLGSLCSCASPTALLTETSPTAPEVLTTPEVRELTMGKFNVKYDKLFETILVMLQEEKCFIETVDKQNGVITAKQYVPLAGNLLDFKTGENRHFSILLIRKNERTTEMRLTIYLEEIVWASAEDGRIYSHREKGLVVEEELYNMWFENLMQRLGL